MSIPENLRPHFNFVSSKLEISPANLDLKVTLSHSHSFCDKSGIFIQTTRDKGGLTADHWLELFFKHELTHFLTAKFWGMPPSLFFEGLAVFISDMDIKKRELGQSYHTQALTLLHTPHYIPFNEITYSHHYLGRRNDFRCDVEAGSFIGFLVESFGLSKVQRVYEASKVPTKSDPDLNIQVVCKEIYQRDLNQLEADWHIWLRTNFKVSSNEIEQVQAFDGYVNDLSMRCPFCLAPRCDCKS